MTPWFLMLAIMHGLYRWPESFPDRAACEAMGRAMIAGESVVDGYACVIEGRDA